MSLNLQIGQSIVCDGYGVGKVLDIYTKDETDFVKVYFDKISMGYETPIEKLSYRNLSTEALIKKAFKLNITEEVNKLLATPFSNQQSILNGKISSGQLESVIFVLRFLDTKKKNSIIHSLSSYDSNLFRQISLNMAQEISYIKEVSETKGMIVLKEFLSKNPIEVITSKAKEEINTRKSFDIDVEEFI